MKSAESFISRGVIKGNSDLFLYMQEYFITNLKSEICNFTLKKKLFEARILCLTDKLH